MHAFCEVLSLALWWIKECFLYLPEPFKGPFFVSAALLTTRLRSTGGTPHNSVPLSTSHGLGLGSSPHPLGSQCKDPRPPSSSAIDFLGLRALKRPLQSLSLPILEAPDSELLRSYLVIYISSESSTIQYTYIYHVYANKMQDPISTRKFAL